MGGVSNSFPSVSVVIPAYLATDSITQTLDSVLAQTIAPQEIILINDGSPDSEQFEARIAPYRRGIVYLTQPNGGPSAARNTGVRRATGEYVAFLDSDDAWLPEFLNEQMTRLRANPAIDLIYSDGYLVGDTPNAGRTLMSLTPSSGPATFDRLVDARCTVFTSCAVAKRQAILDAGLFDVRFRRSEDFHLWLRVAFRGGCIEYHGERLVKHRIRAGSLSADLGAMLDAYVSVLADLDSRLALSRAQRAIVRREIGRQRAYKSLQQAKTMLMAGEYDGAARALAEASAHEPRLTHRMRLWAMRTALRTGPGMLRRAYGMRHDRRLASARQAVTSHLTHR
jgi:glycosyltransferase involved in cell wall biosynthesis